MGVRPRTKFANGSSLSIQASETHYCSPRVGVSWSNPKMSHENVAHLTFYRSYEIAYPEGNCVMPKAVEDMWDQTEDTVLGYVSIELIMELIKANGGLAKE